MEALIIISYAVVGFILYFLLLDRYDMGEKPDPNDLPTIIWLCIMILVWPFIVLGYETRFLGKKYLPRKK